MRTSTTAALAAALAFVAVGATGATALADPPAPSPTPDAPAPAGPVSTIDQDGTFAVNTQIVPGTYSSAGPVGDGVCYWRRIDATGTTLDNAMTKKPQIISIAPGDASFKTSGCQTWQLTDQAPPNQLPPQLNGLKMQGYLAIINGMAGMAPPAPVAPSQGLPAEAHGDPAAPAAPGPASLTPVPPPPG